jgi:hypothetical protein
VVSSAQNIDNVPRADMLRQYQSTGPYVAEYQGELAQTARRLSALIEC